MNLRHQPPVNRNVESVRVGAEPAAARDDTLRAAALAATAAFTLYLFSQFYSLYQEQDWSRLRMLAVMVALLALVTLAEKAGYRLRVAVLLSILMVESLYLLITGGPASNGLALLTTLPALAAILAGWRQGARVFALIGVAVGGLALLDGMGTAPAGNPSTWMLGGMVYLAGGGAVLLALRPLLRHLDDALMSSVLTRNKLDAAQTRFDQEIAGRVSAAEKQAALLKSSQEYTARVEDIDDTDKRIEYTTGFIEEHLGATAVLYYQFDPGQDQYVLKSARGPEMRLLLGQKTSFRSGQPGTPGAAVDPALPVEFQNQGDRPFLFGPEFGRSARTVLVPVMGERRLEGIIRAFHPDEVGDTLMSVYQSLGRRLGTALSAQRRLHGAESQLKLLKAGNEKALRQSWRGRSAPGQQRYGYRFARNQLEPVTEASDLARQVVRVGSPVVTVQAGEPGATTVIMPILFRGNAIGALDIRFEGQYVPKDMVQMIAAVSKRLSLALENARLMEEIQSQVQREHELGEITARVRANTEIEGILRTAAVEIGRALRVSDVLVQLRPED